MAVNKEVIDDFSHKFASLTPSEKPDDDITHETAQAFQNGLSIFMLINQPEVSMDLPEDFESDSTVHILHIVDPKKNTTLFVERLYHPFDSRQNDQAGIYAAWIYVLKGDNAKWRKTKGSPPVSSMIHSFYVAYNSNLQPIKLAPWNENDSRENNIQFYDVSAGSILLNQPETEAKQAELFWQNHDLFEAVLRASEIYQSSDYQSDDQILPNGFILTAPVILE